MWKASEVQDVDATNRSSVDGGRGVRGTMVRAQIEVRVGASDLAAWRWQYERTLWLESHGIDGRQPHWRRLVTALPIELQEEFEQRFVGRWSELLDECLGDCLLRRPELSEIVANSFHYFDGERYDLSDFVVMPNHAHILAGFYDAADMLRRCEAWKSFTAREINRLVGCKGRFWQSDGFDHLVRSPEQFAGLQRYIAENPVRARLKQGEFRHYSRDSK